MINLVEVLIQPELMVMTAAAVAAFAAALSIIMPLLERDRLTRRMKVMALERDKLRMQRMADLKLGKEGQRKLRQTPKGFMQKLVDRLNLRSKYETEELKAKLKMAGLRGQAPLVTYLFLRVAAPIIIAVLALLYLFVVMASLAYPPLIKVIIALGIGIAGFYLPNLILENMIQRRQISIKQTFPDALDMLLICVQAGMSVEAAFGKVAKEIPGQSLELAEEFSLTTAELSYLPERRMAYQNLGKRAGIAGVKAVATALIQAERYGTPIAQALRVMAKEIRDARMSEAEKKAAALPPKLTVPMIVFFLPVLFIVILGPAIIQVMKLGPIDIQDSHRESVLVHCASDQLIRRAAHGEAVRAQ